MRRGAARASEITGIHGFPSEWTEEQLGNILDTLTGIGQQGDFFERFQNNIWNGKEQAALAVGLLPQMLLFGGASYGIGAYRNAKARKNLREKYGAEFASYADAMDKWYREHPEETPLEGGSLTSGQFARIMTDIYAEKNKIDTSNMTDAEMQNIRNDAVIDYGRKIYGEKVSAIADDQAGIEEKAKALTESFRNTHNGAEPSAEEAVQIENDARSWQKTEAFNETMLLEYARALEQAAIEDYRKQNNGKQPDENAMREIAQQAEWQARQEIFNAALENIGLDAEGADRGFFDAIRDSVGKREDAIRRNDLAEYKKWTADIMTQVRLYASMKQQTASADQTGTDQPAQMPTAETPQEQTEQPETEQRNDQAIRAAQLEGAARPNEIKPPAYSGMLGKLRFGSDQSSTPESAEATRQRRISDAYSLPFNAREIIFGETPESDEEMRAVREMAKLLRARDVVFFTPENAEDGRMFNGLENGGVIFLNYANMSNAAGASGHTLMWTFLHEYFHFLKDSSRTRPIYDALLNALDKERQENPELRKRYEEYRTAYDKAMEKIRGQARSSGTEIAPRYHLEDEILNDFAADVLSDPNRLARVLARIDSEKQKSFWEAFKAYIRRMFDRIASSENPWLKNVFAQRIDQFNELAAMIENAVVAGAENLREQTVADNARPARSAESTPPGTLIPNPDTVAAMADVDGTKNNPAEVYTPDAKEKVKVVYAFVPIDAIISSEQPGYPQALQPRMIDTQKRRETANRIASSLIPGLLTINPISSNGSPILTKDNISVTGNTRLEAMRIVYDMFKQGKDNGRWSSIQTEMKRLAKIYGISIPSGRNDYIFVRYIQDNLTQDRLIDFARRSNESSVDIMAEAEQALSDADVLTSSGVLDLMNPVEGDAGINQANNGGFLNAVLSAFQNASAMRDTSGAFTEAGMKRIYNALFAALFRNEERKTAQAVILRAIENSEGLKTQFRSIAHMAPRILALAKRKPAYDISADVANAFGIYSDFIVARRNGGSAKTISDFLAQRE